MSAPGFSSSADIAALAAALRGGDRRALARAITLAESTRGDHQRAAEHLLECLLPATGQSIRVGITGSPGVGKSTFIESLGLHLLAAGRRPAVLSIDPSSSVGGGSILGDKTRMQRLAREQNAFIRPTPAGRLLGGVARRTREALLLTEAAGFDVVIVETVGVGQSETAVAETTDMFLLLLLPGGGDDLQGIKRGVMELADLVLINKADGDLLAAAGRTAADFRNALGLLRPRTPAWQVPVALCSALNSSGIDQVWQHIVTFHEMLDANGGLAARRAGQARSWLWQETGETLMTLLRAHPAVMGRLAELEHAVMAGRLPAPAAARELVARFLDQAGQDLNRPEH